MSIRNALLLVVAVALLAGIVPAGLAVDRWLSRELTARARVELEMSGPLLEDRNAALADGLMMRAKDLASAEGLSGALSAGLVEEAAFALSSSADDYGDALVLVGPDGVTRLGPDPGDSLRAAARRGEMPVAIVETASGPAFVGLAPVTEDSTWVGTVGVALPMDEEMATTLAGLTRAGVVFVDRAGHVTAASGDSAIAAGLVQAAVADPGGLPAEDRAGRLPVGDATYLLAWHGLGAGTRVVFYRSLDDVLAVLPRLRRAGGLIALVALGLALLLGALLATFLARPVERLADVADRLGRKDFDAAPAPSRIRELNRLSGAFEAMRASLASHVDEILRTNQELSERQERLRLLQAELLRRERAAASGHVVAELAHEIRNPVAGLRNLLELLRRRLGHDPRGREFADLAVEELMRMHELAETILDTHRPSEDGGDAPVRAVAERVAALVTPRTGENGLAIAVEGPEARAAIPADDLRQILLNLVRNAAEAMGGRGTVEIRLAEAGERVVVEVLDRGHGLDEASRERLFDPFFTTKEEGEGTGLGLYIAQGVVGRSGGRIRAENREDGPGAVFRVEIPRAAEAS